MVMLPDYPDRVISKQTKRLENISLFTSLTIILIGAWWLFNSIDSDSGAIVRFGPVIILFISAFLINDLIIFSSREKFRLGTFSNIFWPCILAFVILQIDPSINLFPNILLLIIAIFLFYFSHSIFLESTQSRRWRGISSLLGLSISISIISQSDSLNKFVLVIGIQLITIIPDFLFNDDKAEERKEFSLQLKKLELRIIESQNQIFGMQQPNSLLKSAKEVGWKDPDLGLELVKDANNEISRLLYLKQDILEIKNDTEETIRRLEQLNNHPNGPREMFISGENEMDLGSFREAELLFRKSKEKSIFLEKYWNQASRKIDEAIQLVKSDNSKSTGNLNTLIEASKEAMERERPDEAIKILESLTDHLEGMNDVINEAKKSINEAEIAISSLSENIKENLSDRMKQSIIALKEGDAPLAKGLSDSILRQIKNISESMNRVKIALKQRTKIHERFPKGKNYEYWEGRLNSIIRNANKFNWIEASSLLEELIIDLDELESQSEETFELLEFIQSDWSKLRNIAESNGIGPENEERKSLEKKISKAENLLIEGEIQESLKMIAVCDEIMESIRRKIKIYD